MDICKKFLCNPANQPANQPTDKANSHGLKHNLLGVGKYKLQISNEAWQQVACLLKFDRWKQKNVRVKNYEPSDGGEKIISAWLRGVRIMTMQKLTGMTQTFPLRLLLFKSNTWFLIFQKLFTVSFPIGGFILKVKSRKCKLLMDKFLHLCYLHE